MQAPSPYVCYFYQEGGIASSRTTVYWIGIFTTKVHCRAKGKQKSARRPVSSYPSLVSHCNVLSALSTMAKMAMSLCRLLLQSGQGWAVNGSQVMSCPCYDSNGHTSDFRHALVSAIRVYKKHFLARPNSQAKYLVGDANYLHLKLCWSRRPCPPHTFVSLDTTNSVVMDMDVPFFSRSSFD